MRARGMPLDLMPGTGYEEKEIILHASEAALFYSDGLVKAHDLEGKMFGFPRLRALIAEHGKDRSLGNLQITEPVLLARVYSFRPIWAPYTGEIHGRSSYSYRFSESLLPRPSVQQAAADVPPSRDRLSWYP
jgi:hypothetical protein